MSLKDDLLSDADYAALSTFRHEIRKFLAFSETMAAEVGLTPQQHQALLAIRGAQAGQATVGYVADRLILKPHSATGLLDRLESIGLITRRTDKDDRRRAVLQLTKKAHALLHSLSATHRDEIRRLRPMLNEIFASLG